MKNSSSHRPPRWIRQLLSRFLEPRLLEGCLGDLEEKFNRYIQGDSPLWKARLLYALEGIGFLRLAARQKDSSDTQTTINMISHTLLFFSRLVRKDKSYYLVSMLGLSISLASFLLITMFVRDELAYDKFHVNKDHLYRVAVHLKSGDVDFHLATTQFPAAHALQSELPEVDQAIRIFKEHPVLEHGDLKFEEDIVMVDHGFFDAFSFPFILGDPKTALAEPSSIVLTETTAKKYFGTDNPIGKTLVAFGQISLSVTGVVADAPKQSHLKFKAVVPLQLQLDHWKSQTGIEGRENKWFWYGTYTYLLLKEGSNAGQVTSKLPVIIDKYFPERFKHDARLELQPITDIHLRSGLAQEFEPGGSILYVQLFAIVALVIMVVSAINLINLSHFKITSRFKEVGIRKFLGQSTSRILGQLSMESSLVGIVSFALATSVCLFFINPFNTLVNKNLELTSGPNIRILAWSFILVVIICIGAILRPALRVATQRSYSLLQQYRSRDRARVRNILIGLQVCFSFVLLVFSLIVSQQIEFFRSKDLGFDRHNLVTIELNDDIYPKLDAFKNELRASKDIIEVSGGPAPGMGINGWRFVPEGGSREKPYLMRLAWVDPDFLRALNVKLLDGRDFPPRVNYDSLWPFIINKRAALEFDWVDDAVNKSIEVFAAGTTEIMAKGIVIGVMDDYHYESLHTAVEPLILTAADGFSTAIVRFSGKQSKDGIASIEEVWKKFSDKPLVYQSLDQRLDELYNQEASLSNVILFFTAIGLYLTCYGLFAMSALLFSSRLKEVAIRKVFGADHLNIVKQLYSRYALFNLIAIITGIPIAIYVGNLWLQTFQFRIDLESDLFIKAGLFILTAGLISVSYYLARVAMSNPVAFLRRE